MVGLGAGCIFGLPCGYWGAGGKIFMKSILNISQRSGPVCEPQAIARDIGSKLLAHGMGSQMNTYILPTQKLR